MDRRVQRAIDSMKADLGRDVALDEIARSVNLSHSRLRCLFKAETGMSPRHYLKHLRMEEAKRLTESTFLNVKQIMNKLGMRDESHFVRDFKRIHGVTPSQYRMSCNGNHGREDGSRQESKGAAH
jgi:transcriptional regulator GlxA family with amidase domain